ncbi:MAG: transporter [Ignavibacteriota bacterium]|nr:transporter [Ignavibacteriota bacterium]
MKKLLILIFIFLISKASYSQVCCGGGVYDVAVLSLNKRALFNVGYKYDNNLGVWDSDKEWRKISQTSYQMTPAFSGAYRFNKEFQAGILIPLVINKNELPGLPSDGSGIGDVVLSGRFEIFHEYSLYKDKGKILTDKKTPYFAVTFGMTFPTGKSDEEAQSEVGISGKGYFTTSLGLSFIKTILKDKIQIGSDVNWQHSFTKTYEKYYGESVPPYERRQGERFNYSVTANYLLNFYNSVSFSLGGFYQSDYSINGTGISNSDESAFSMVASYTWYPKTYVRVSPLIKWNIPNTGYGKNATGTVLYGLNLVYYLENLEDL